jgi:hypothetical protein
MKGSRATSPGRASDCKLIRVLGLLPCGWFLAASLCLGQMNTPDSPTQYRQTKPLKPAGVVEPRPGLAALPAQQLWPGAQPSGWRGETEPKPAGGYQLEWSRDEANLQPSAEVTEESLVPLLIEERKLLTFCGPEHPQLLEVRERIQEIRAYLQRHKPVPPAKAEHPLLPLISEPVVPCTRILPPPEPPRQPIQPIALATYQVQLPPLLPAAVERATPPVAVGVVPQASPKGQGPLLSPEKKEGTSSEVAKKSRAKAVKTVPASAVPLPSQSLPLDTARACDQALEAHLTKEGQLAKLCLGMLSVHLFGIMGTLLVAGLFIHILALVVILRWYGKWFVRRISTQFVRMPLAGGTTPGIARAPRELTEETPALAVPAQVAPEVVSGEEAEEESGLVTGERFELGPTYEEEMRMRQEAEKQREAAILRHIFEENMRMRLQLEHLPAEAA